MRGNELLICISVIGQAVAVASDSDPLEPYRESAARWEKQIENFRKIDAANPGPEDAILVIGSSSIRIWDTIQEDLAPYSVIKRGFGGASISDIAIYADDLIAPHDCRAIVFFVGARDASGKDGEKSAEEICKLTNLLVRKVRKLKGGVPIIFMEITPSPARVYMEQEVAEVNSVISAVCRANPNVHWLKTSHRFLHNGTPIPRLFAENRVHLSDQGYNIWSQLLTKRLSETLQSQTSL